MNATKGRSIEVWLNQCLGQAKAREGGDKTVANAAAKGSAGLSQFGIDAPSLERLGLDSKAVERVYRAMFVYSQGLHAVLKEEAEQTTNASQALLVLWRAFTAVVDNASQREQQGVESLAALMVRGSEEDKARIQNEHRTQIENYQAQIQKLHGERRCLQDEARESETRIWNDAETQRMRADAAGVKYEREVKQRIELGMKSLESIRWADALQEDLVKERSQCLKLQSLLADASRTKETAQVESDSLRVQIKTQEAQASSYKQSAFEAAQQRQRHEQQASQYRHNVERMTTKIAELKDQLEQEAERTKQLLEETQIFQREVRKLETLYEDEAHARRELQNERDTQSDKIARLDVEFSGLTEERRRMQKENNDLSMAYRTNEIELKRKCEQFDRAETQLMKLTLNHRELSEMHRDLSAEASTLREDVGQLDAQFRRESDFRKRLQSENKLFMGQLQQVHVERDTATRALSGTQKELGEAVAKIVKLESIIRDQNQSMLQMTLMHQTEVKAHTQKATMLERVIEDERTERRGLVIETEEAVGKREEAFAKLKSRTQVHEDVKRQRLDQEEELDRLKVLLRAQEIRNSEQLVTVDRYHAGVANHEAEMRQMHVLLECEGVEVKRQLQEMQSIQTSARETMQLRVEQWKMCFEDVCARWNFNPATFRLTAAEARVDELEKELTSSSQIITAQRVKFSNVEKAMEKREVRIEELQRSLAESLKQAEQSKALHAASLRQCERQSMALGDVEVRYAVLGAHAATFDELKVSLEAKIEELVDKNKALVALIETESRDQSVQASVMHDDGGVQTDLSYQYLESSERIKVDRGRMERLVKLKKASHFLADGDMQRDFVVPGESDGSTGPRRTSSVFAGRGSVGIPCSEDTGTSSRNSVATMPRTYQDARLSIGRTSTASHDGAQRRASFTATIGAAALDDHLAAGPVPNSNLHVANPARVRAGGR